MPNFGLESLDMPKFCRESLDMSLDMSPGNWLHVKLFDVLETFFITDLLRL